MNFGYGNVLGIYLGHVVGLQGSQPSGPEGSERIAVTNRHGIGGMPHAGDPD